MAEHTPCILLMCKDLAAAAMHRARLALDGWEVLKASDEVDALSAAKSQRVDLALLHVPEHDIDSAVLPDVLREVSSTDYLPVAILAPDMPEHLRCQLLDSGADEVISEGISAREIAARLRALLRIKQLHDELAASGQALQKALDRERGLMVELRERNEHLQVLATTDPLTRAQNVRSFRDILGHEFSMAKRYERPLSLLMLDIDHFKVVNDTHGHPSGDYVLKELTVILKQSVRESDVVARTGGEEFSVVLPQAGPDEAAGFAERIRRHVYSRQFIVYGDTIHITASIGMACFPADAEIGEPEMLAYFADQALLMAKESGRDRVVTVADMDMSIRRRLRRQYMDMNAAKHDAQPVNASQH